MGICLAAAAEAGVWGARGSDLGVLGFGHRCCLDGVLWLSCDVVGLDARCDMTRLG